MSDLINKANINIIEKIRWRVQFSKFWKIFGNDANIVSLILGNKEIATYIRQNQNDIIQLINNIQKNVDIPTNNIFIMISQAVVRGSINNVMLNINYLLENLEHGDKEATQIESVKTEKTGLIKKMLEEANIDIFEDENCKKDIEKNNQRIRVIRALEKVYGSEKLGEVISTYDAVNCQINSYNHNPKVLATVQMYFVNLFKSGTDLRRISALGDGYFKVNRSLIKGDKKMAEFFLEDPGRILFTGPGFYSRENIESNKYIEKWCMENAESIEKVFDARNAVFDGHIAIEKEKGNIEMVKELICKRYFCMDISYLPNEIGNLPEETQKVLHTIREIYNCNTIDEIQSIVNQLESFSPDKIVEKHNDVCNRQREEFAAGIFRFDNEEKFEDDNGVKVYHLTGEDFTGLIHCTGNTQYREFVDRGKALCTSLTSDRAMQFFKSSSKTIRLGYCIHNNDELVNYTKGGAGDYYLHPKRILESQFHINDCIEETEKNGAINEVNIVPRNPDYVFCIDSIDSASRSYAEKCGIPIVLIHSRDYFEKYKSLFMEKNEYMRNNYNKITLEDFKELNRFRRQQHRLIGPRPDDWYTTFFLFTKDNEKIKENPAFIKDVYTFLGCDTNEMIIDRMKKVIINFYMKQNGCEEERAKEYIDGWLASIQSIDKNTEISRE